MDRHWRLRGNLVTASYSSYDFACIDVNNILCLVYLVYLVLFILGNFLKFIRVLSTTIATDDDDDDGLMSSANVPSEHS